MIMIDIKEKLSQLPMMPGCYLMKDKNGVIIYVGKAKKLKNRVSSYFNKVHEYKTEQLVKHIYDFEYIICNSEKEALILELNLIKEHRPYYNVLLKDDKQYPYIELTKELYPRLRITRNIKHNRSRLFGPFPDSQSARETVKLLNRIFPVRKCATLPKKECLYYHISQCLAPCVLDIPPQTYQDMSLEIERFLKGDTSNIVKNIETERNEASDKLLFEKAHEMQLLLKDIEHVIEKQQVQTSRTLNRDIFGVALIDDYVAVQTVLIREGKMLAVNLEISKIIGDVSDIIESMLLQFYDKHTLPNSIVVDDCVDCELLSDILNTKVMHAKKGQPLSQLNLAKNNASEGLKHYLALNHRVDEKDIIEQLGQLLNIDIPYRIEVFDVSNLHQSHQVCGMVVYENGLPSKKAYRKYKIKNTELQSDLERMAEVIYRRYFRLLSEKQTMPTLIIVDGGAVHVKNAQKVLASLSLKIPVVGLAKDDKHQTDALIDSHLRRIEIKSNRELFRFLTRVQDEVHRYAISFHQQQRSKSMTSSILDEIPQLGSVRKQKLLAHFSTYANIKKASIHELCQVVPESVAKNIYNHLKKI